MDFLPAGSLKVQCVAGRNLIDTETVGRQDPYVLFQTEGAVSDSRLAIHRHVIVDFSVQKNKN